MSSWREQAIKALEDSLFPVPQELNGIDWKWVRISSLGSIVTLVFHRELLHTPIKLVKDSDMDIFSANLLLFLSSAIVLIAFVPIIMIVKRVFPVVLGRRAKNI